MINTLSRDEAGRVKEPKQPTCPPHYWFDDVDFAGCEICGLTREEVEQSEPPSDAD